MKILKFLSVGLMILGLSACDFGGGNMKPINVNLFAESKEIRMGGYSTGTEASIEHYLKQVAPYDDTYTIKTNEYTTYKLYSSTGEFLLEVPVKSSKNIQLKKGDVVLALATGTEGEKLEFEVELDEHESLLPYDPINVVDPTNLLATDKSGYDPLVAANLEYIKREGGMYINCNNPEKLTDACLNVALTRNDVSNKEVFFTFEHNNYITGSFYYGYQVMNKGTKDVFVTVKNIGFQLNGAGSWLGEREWTDFYNTEFRMKGYADYNQSQLETLQAYFDFCNKYKTPNNQPITYRIPAGKHIYVMGGTTADSYNKTNVFKTADLKVGGGCSNGAVLFEVIGENVEASFYAYKNHKNVQADNTTHQGYVAVGSDGHEYGRQYVGYDNCHGVVDANLTWEFSDHTPSQNLPVTYTNYYKAGIKETGNVPYSKIDSTPHINNLDYWVTHINPQNSHEGVGTDMTKYYTIDSTGKEICIDSDHIDGLGYTANIGNWMIDYMENYTFVNHGDENRKITVSFINNGSVAVLVRDADGKYIEGTAQYTICKSASSHGAAIQDKFIFEIIVPRHSVVQFTVEYNLLANSSGYIKHFVRLD